MVATLICSERNSYVLVSSSSPYCVVTCGRRKEVAREAKLKSMLTCLKWEAKHKLSDEKDSVYKVAIKASQDCGMVSRE